MKKYKKQFLTIFILLILFLCSFCFAIDIPDPKEAENLASLGKIIFNFLLSLSILVAFGVLIWAGVIWFLSAGQSAQIQESKTKIKGAVLGLVMIFFSYLIITTINPDLTVFKVTEFKTPPQVSTPHTPTPPSINTTTYQEIPLGQLSENILAKNISCFDDDNNLVNCNNPEDIIQEKPNDVYHQDNHIYFCYEYDENGDRKSLLKNKDRFYCYNLLLEAAKIKFEKMQEISEDIQKLTINGCKCSLCSGGIPIGCIDGKPPCGSCTDNCSCCGSPRNENPYASSSCGSGPYNTDEMSTDPCSNRSSIDQKREELSQLLTGEIMDGLDDYYDPLIDPEVTTKFLTIKNIKERLEAMKQDFQKELNDLNTAESLMMFPEGDRLSRNEFNVLKSKESALNNNKNIASNNFYEYTSNVYYCNEFNCEDQNNDTFKETCNLNAENRYCKIAEAKPEFINDGDPATFYFNETETRNYFYSSLACNIDVKKEENIIKGLIPIGITVDNSEAFASIVINFFDMLLQNTIKEIAQGNAIYSLPEDCHCRNCESHANTYGTCCRSGNDGSCSDSLCSCCPDRKKCKRRQYACTSCTGTICPFSTIDSTIIEMDDILNNHIPTDETILNFNQTIINLNKFVFAEELEENVPNRFTTLTLLNISRKRLNTCFTKYNFDGERSSAIMDTISCESIHKWKNTEYLTFSPDFILTENKGYFDCYPYNIEEKLRGACVINLDSDQCLKIRSNYMNNYYCCNSK